MILSFNIINYREAAGWRKSFEFGPQLAPPVHPLRAAAARLGPGPTNGSSRKFATFHAGVA